MMEKWAEETRKRKILRTKNDLDYNLCPACTNEFRGDVVKVISLETYPRRGNGYFEIVGCPVCKRVFFKEVEE